jgi:ribosomal protein L29
MNNYIEQLKEQIEELESKLFELRQELAEKEGYKTVEDLGGTY